MFARSRGEEKPRAAPCETMNPGPSQPPLGWNFPHGAGRSLAQALRKAGQAQLPAALAPPHLALPTQSPTPFV